MSKLWVFSTLIIASGAMLLFVLGFLCWQLGLAMWAAVIYRLAGLGMLMAFSSLLLLGLLSLLIAIGRDLRGYSSVEARALRQLLSVYKRGNDQRQRMFAQAKQLRFWAHVKRRRLLARDDRRQLRSLFLAIDTDLKIARQRLTREHYKDLRKALRNYRKQADVEGMLALREKL